MGSPARRLTNPITRCRDQPHYGYAGTDDGRGTDQSLTKTSYADERMLCDKLDRRVRGNVYPIAAFIAQAVTRAQPGRSTRPVDQSST